MLKLFVGYTRLHGRIPMMFELVFRFRLHSNGQNSKFAEATINNRLLPQRCSHVQDRFTNVWDVCDRREHVFNRLSTFFLKPIKKGFVPWPQTVTRCVRHSCHRSLQPCPLRYNTRPEAVELVADVSGFHVDDFTSPREDHALWIVLLVYDAEVVQALKQFRQAGQT